MRERVRLGLKGKNNVILTLVGLGLSIFALPASAQQASSSCDASLAKHVYNPKRLVVQKPCVEFVGVKQDATHGKRSNGCRKEADGDDHCWIKLDAPQGFVNEENVSKQEGNLVYEPMCQHKVTQADAKAACKGWSQQILVVPVGARIKLRGAWVLDTQHGHMECHPCEVLQ